MKKTLVIFPAFLLSGACALLGPSGETPQPVAVAPRDLQSDEGLQPIANAALPAGECGMVLWTLEGDRPSAVFQYTSEKTASIVLAGQPVKLVRTDYGGAAGYGVFESQRFESTDGVQVEVTARFGLEFAGGAYLERGLIKVRDQTGWSIVSPSAGVAGCRR